MLIQTLEKLITEVPSLRVFGTVKGIQGLLLRVASRSNQAYIGSLCTIETRKGETVLGEVVGFEGQLILVMSYGSLDEIPPGARAEFLDEKSLSQGVFPSEQWLGRVMNGLCQPIDGNGLLPQGPLKIPLRNTPPPANARHKITKRLDVGIKAINTFLTVCKGQRLGIFSGSGVGKSKLLSMLARYTNCDVCVIGLIGERGREVREFIEDTLGEEGLKRSVIVVATSDESPLLRRRAAHTTLSIAEYFRDQGKSVLCLMDSITRLAMAQREIGLSVGEPPTTKGYTPSVFTELSKVMERAGPGVGEGTITALFTVLVDGDDHNEPIADATRGILDGHIVLDRAIAERGHYPAIHILRSISRMVPNCHSAEEQRIVKRARQVLATYENMADMIRLGAYRAGSSSEIDEAIALYPTLLAFLEQHHDIQVGLEDGFNQLKVIVER